MKYINDKRGFTLVELLAVIVILALIMGIAAFSMQGVTENVRIGSMKSSAMTYIEGVRKMLLANMNINAGDYYISDTMLQKKVSSPWGEYVYYSTNPADAITTTLSQHGYAKATGTLVCGGTGTGSFVRVTQNGTNYDYAICLYDDAGNYIFASESVLQKDADKSDYYLSYSGTNAVTMDATTGHIQAPAA